MALLPERECHTIIPVIHIYLSQCPMFITASGARCSFDAQWVRMDGCVWLMLTRRLSGEVHGGYAKVEVPLTASIPRQKEIVLPMHSAYDWMYVAAHDGCLDRKKQGIAST
jgi:hypothetical protein